MSALDLLCATIAQGNKTSASTYRTAPDYRALLDCGLLKEVGAISSVPCLDCDQPHDAEVVHDGRTYGYHCPDLGFLPLDPAEIAAVAADLPALVARLADLYGCKRRKSDPVRGTTWRVGAAGSGGGDIVIYFHPRLIDECDAKDVGDALAREVAAPFRLILTAQGGAPLPGAIVVPLSEIVGLDTSTGRFQALADLSIIVGMPVQRGGGAPNLFASKLKALIDARMASGAALQGVNAEARALVSNYEATHPGERVPSLATIKRYLTNARGGS